jgi:alkane 1-monooxygenase
MKKHWELVRGLNRDMRLCVWTNGLTGFTVDGGIYAVVLNLYLLRLGYGAQFIGAVNGAGLLAYGLFSLAAGCLGSRFGTRGMITLGLALMAAGGCALPLVELVAPSLGAGWILASFIVTNVGLALQVTNCTPFLTESSQAGERHTFFSIVATVWSLAGFAGNVVGGLLPPLFGFFLSVSLGDAAPYRYSLWLAPVLLLPAAVLMLTTRAVARKPTNDSPEQLIPSANGDAQIAMLALVRFLFVLGCGAVLIFLNMYLDKDLGAGAAGIGLLLGAGRLCAGAMCLFAPMLAARWSKANLILATAVGTALSMIPLILLAQTTAAAFSFIGVMTLLAVRLPTWLAYSMEAARPARRGLMSGAGEMANGLGFAVVGLGGGYVINTLGYRPLFLLCACLTAVGAWLFARYCRPQQPALVPGNASKMGRKTAFKPLGYLLVFLLSALQPIGVLLAGYGLNLTAAAWFPLIAIFFIITIIDYGIGPDADNPSSKQEIAQLQSTSYYRILTLVCLPVQIALLFWSANEFSSEPLTWAGGFGWILSLGLVNAMVSMNAAHELVHQPARIERWFGGILLSTVCYGTFKVQHIAGHHVDVSTRKDRSLGLLGESVYAYWLRAWKSYFTEAWSLEAKRLRRNGQSPIHWRNELIWWTALSILILALFAYLFGLRGALFFLAQSIVACSVVEAINYIEHYGLERRQLADGRFEPVTRFHSWNSNYYLTSLILFQLQRHSDHHHISSRRYQALLHHEDSPQLPGGYPAMLLLSLVPPLWRRVIHPRIDAFKARQEVV